jgi:hypothetical protein
LIQLDAPAVVTIAVGLGGLDSSREARLAAVNPCDRTVAIDRGCWLIQY